MNGQPGPSRGLPILSGPPPVTESDSCRQCGKDFNPLWRRAHTCGHCGYEYCNNCIADGQALMPRRPGQGSLNKGPLAEIRSGLGLDDLPAGSGYEVESVCTPCLSMLQVTCAPVDSLRALPLKRLKDYLTAYNIPNVGPKEKEDFVQAVVKARNPRTGSLSQESETYYRRNSVPRKASTTSSSAPPRNPHQGRPPPPGSHPPPRTQARPPPPQARARPPPPQQQYRPPFPHQYRPPPPAARPPQPQPPKTPTARPAPTPPPPVPTIMGLVSLPNSYLSTLSIGTLKAILYENHVRVDFKQVLEKEELIARVAELVNAERRRLERQRYEEERLARGDADTAPAPGSTPELNGNGDGAADGDGGEAVTDKKQVPTGPMPEIERGLCVVCQDEEATLAVVDCGHLAMCQHCSELIMATSQECPLCRTRIVTSQRLIRIYRV